MIQKELIEFIFESASIERWNDHIRPSRGFSELDKQAHKMVYAYVFSKLAIERGEDIDLLKVAEGGIFEFLHRLVLTDIKPPIFHKLMDEKGSQINGWVISSLDKMIKDLPLGFSDKFKRYFTDSEYCKNEKNILKVSHYSATKWEFNIIYGMCQSYFGIEDTRREIDEQMRDFEEYSYFNSFMHNQNLISFTNLLGELRFQQRWSRSPRIPATSVMGHMLLVALMSYFCSCEINACDRRTVNNFFAGLFHDVPEVLTRDIVSPVKSSVDGLDELIKNIEGEQMNEKIYPFIPDDWRKELDYYTHNEFESKIEKNSEVLITTSEEISKSYNSDEYNPLDGRIIRGCDHFGALLETYFSHSYGVTSSTLRDANRGLQESYRGRVIGGINFGEMFSRFAIE